MEFQELTFYGIPWNSIDTPTLYHKNQWNSMVFHGGISHGIQSGNAGLINVFRTLKIILFSTSIN